MGPPVAPSRMGTGTPARRNWMPGYDVPAGQWFPAQFQMLVPERLSTCPMTSRSTRACPVDLSVCFSFDSVMVDDRLNRHDLTDSEWALVELLLPAHPRQGHRWNDHRVVINGVFFRTRAGCPWRDLPREDRKLQNRDYRHRRWAGDGTWEE